MDAEIGGIVAPWSAAEAITSATGRARQDRGRLAHEQRPPWRCRRDEDHPGPADAVHEPADERSGQAYGQRLGGEHGADLRRSRSPRGASAGRSRAAAIANGRRPIGVNTREPRDAGRAQHVEVAAQLHGHIDCRAVPVKTEAIGKSYPPFEYEVGKEKIARVRPRGG